MPVIGDSGEAVRVAGLARRAAARAVDALCLLGLYVLALAAAVIVMAIGLLIFVVSGRVDILGGGSGESLVFLSLLALLWVAAAWWAMRRYELVSTARCGQTLGKRLMGICVVCCPSGVLVEPPSFHASSRRCAVPHGAALATAVLSLLAVYVADERGLTDREGVLLLSSVFAVGVLAWAACYVSALFGSQRRGWHDKLAGTVVVRATDDVLERLAAHVPRAGATIADEARRWG